MKIGDTVNYSFPGLSLVSSGGKSKGIIQKISPSGKYITVEDVEIEPGEKKKYSRIIAATQIVNL